MAAGEFAGDGASPSDPSAVDPAVRRRLCELIELRTGIKLTGRHAEEVVESLRRVAAERGLAGDRIALAVCETDADALADLVRSVAVRETHFFRNRPHFRALEDVVLPDLLARRKALGRLRIWSAGCATGEEAYSLAMTLDATAQRLDVDLGDWRVELVATDMDEAALAHARQGEYGPYSLRGVSEQEVDAWFDRRGERVQVRDRHLAMVKFRPLNLVMDRFPSPGTFFEDVDLIICRNVTIYFAEATTRALADRFFESLAEGGYLVVGHAEHSLETYRRYQTRVLPDAVLYQRGGEGWPALPALDAAPGSEPASGSEPALNGGWPRTRLIARSWAARPGHLGAPDVPVGSCAPAAFAPPAADAAPAPASLAGARAAASSGDLNAAAELAVQVLESRPDDGAACLFLGQLAADRGHAAEATIWLERALRQRPLEVAAHYLLAVLALERGDGDAARRHVDQALYVRPDCVMAHHLAARLHRDQGRPEAAERSRQSALRALEALAPDELVEFAEGLTAAQLKGMLSR